MLLHLIALGFPEWQPHFSFLRGGFANEMIVLRWLHLIFGIIWIGLLYFFNLVLTPAMKKCDPKLRIKIYPELMPGAKGILDIPGVRAIGVSVVVIAASWLVLSLNGGPNVSNAHLAISVGGGLGLVMLLNTWGVVWRVQKRLIAWSRASAEQGVPMPPEAERLMRWNYLTARTSFWLSFPMLFFMGAASHYPFLSTVAR